LALNFEEQTTLKTVITFGTFDVFHSGHVNILRRSREMGDRLVVGISSDQLNFSKKGRNPVYPLRSRMNILHAIKYIDQVFVEESLDLKREYIIEHQADILVMGDDWSGKFDQFTDICEVKYLARTPSISTTEIIEVIKDI
jgi:glycerol-3-phosphate cytidylyltransferase